MIRGLFSFLYIVIFFFSYQSSIRLDEHLINRFWNSVGNLYFSLIFFSFIFYFPVACEMCSTYTQRSLWFLGFFIQFPITIFVYYLKRNIVILSFDNEHWYGLLLYQWKYVHFVGGALEETSENQSYLLRLHLDHWMDMVLVYNLKVKLELNGF